GLALGVGRRFMGGLEGIPGDGEIGLQPVDDQRLEAGLVHGNSGGGLAPAILPETFGDLRRADGIAPAGKVRAQTKPLRKNKGQPMLTVNLGPLTLAVPHLLLMISL